MRLSLINEHDCDMYRLDLYFWFNEVFFCFKWLIKNYWAILFNWSNKLPLVQNIFKKTVLNDRYNLNLKYMSNKPKNKEAQLRENEPSSNDLNK